MDSSVRYLGVTLDKRLTFHKHISSTLGRCRQRLRQLKPVLGAKSSMSLEMKRLVYLTIIRPIWEYGSHVWGGASDSQVRRVQTFQNRALRVIADAPWFVRNDLLHKDLDIPSIKTVLQATYTRFHARIHYHPNPLAAGILDAVPPNRPNRRLKRKRHTDLLTQPAP